MEIRVIGRGALAGVVAGMLGFIFARIWVEPVIAKAIDYESGRADILAALNTSAGRTVAPDGPEVFSRTIQSTLGLASGIIAFSVAMGVLVAVGYLVVRGRFAVRPQRLAWLISGFGLLGLFLLPFVKYPADPPGIGHALAIVTRGQLYLAMVATSLGLLGLAVFVARRLAPRFGPSRAVVVAAVGFIVLYGVVLAVLPSSNIISTPLTVDGKTSAPAQIVYPGFDADVLWKFRWYSLLNQLLIWTTIAATFGAMVERLATTHAKPTMASVA